MDRIVLIGNGFDLAHGLPTRYEDFINWYWEERGDRMMLKDSHIDQDCLSSFELLLNGYSWWQYSSCNYFSMKGITGQKFINHIKSDSNCSIRFTPFARAINHAIENKGWVDIEKEYYDMLCSFLYQAKYKNPKALNEELVFLKNKLIEYLDKIQKKHISCQILNGRIKEKLFEPIRLSDIAVGAEQYREEFIHERNRYGKEQWQRLLWYYYPDILGIDLEHIIDDITQEKKILNENSNTTVAVNSYNKDFFLLPDKVMLLNFNYTSTADLYVQGKADAFTVNHIHGDLSNPENVIFGYGDEREEKYKKLMDLHDNEFLRNIKSVKYLETENYRNLLSFADSSPFQIYIMGHSCGNSDGTLLNTLFEHRNCVSIKPFYFAEDGHDNYGDIVANISRNFNDMRLMRDRVVNKVYCEPLPQRGDE